MAETRIVIIGGGSYNAGPKILGDLLLTKELSGSTIVLYDIDAEKLKVMERLAQKMIEKAQARCKVTAAAGLEEALQNAEFVIAAINVGGFEAFRQDIEIPQNFGLWQSYGECVGPSGTMRALRSIPVFMEIIKEMEHICPGAWLINFTNPIGTLCRLANKVSSIKTIGVSNEFTGTYPFIKKALAVRDAALLTLKVGGINRLSWILDANYDRKDMLPEMKQHMERYAAKPRNNAEGGEESHYVKCELLRIFGYLPYAEDRKLAEMAPFFLTPETQRGEKYGVRLVNLKKLRSDLMSKKDKIEHAAASKNPVNFSKSTSDLADMVATLANRGEGTFVVNVPNRGSISNLPFDAVVEVFGYFNNRKVGEPVIGDLPTGILGITEPHVINQELVVEAALRGSRKIALRALLLDPLNRSITTAEKVFDQLLRAHKQYLPQFF